MRVAPALLALAMLVAQEKTKTLDTGLGFTLAVPEAWTVAPASGNNKLAAGRGDEDISVVVTHFGPAAPGSEARYRDGFVAAGFALESEADATVAGATVKKYVFAVKTPAGPGRAEVVILPVGGEVYSVMVTTPAASLPARQAVIAKIFESIAIKKESTK